MFYWRPLGEQFPGLDSVYKEGSSNLYFITHVKTGKAVDEFDSGWIEKAVRISTLVYEKLGRPEIKCTLLLGCAPQSPPVLGKRKRKGLVKSHQELKTWDFKYLTGPNLAGNPPPNINLSLEIFREMKEEFNLFMHLNGPQVG
jgi:hypothetical protein